MRSASLVSVASVPRLTSPDLSATCSSRWARHSRDSPLSCSSTLYEPLSHSLRRSPRTERATHNRTQKRRGHRSSRSYDRSSKSRMSRMQTRKRTCHGSTSTWLAGLNRLWSAMSPRRKSSARSQSPAKTPSSSSTATSTSRQTICEMVWLLA